jgi:GTP-binding protein
VFEAIEKFSVVKTLQSISDANVVILLLDARQDISDQDAHIAGFVVEQGRALVVGVNKWDGLDSHVRERTKADLERKLKFLDFAKFHFISAAEKSGIGPLMRSVDDAYAAAMSKRTDRRSRIPAAAPAGSGSSEAALCAPGRPKPANYRDSRQCARRDHGNV